MQRLLFFYSIKKNVLKKKKLKFFIKTFLNFKKRKSYLRGGENDINGIDGFLVLLYCLYYLL